MRANAVLPCHAIILIAGISFTAKRKPSNICSVCSTMYHARETDRQVVDYIHTHAQHECLHSSVLHAYNISHPTCSPSFSILLKRWRRWTRNAEVRCSASSRHQQQQQRNSRAARAFSKLQRMTKYSIKCKVNRVHATTVVGKCISEYGLVGVGHAAAAHACMLL